MATPDEGTRLREDFDDFFDTALCGFLIATPEGRILRINARLAEWIGKPPPALQGALISDILTLAGRMYYETHLGPLLRMQGFFDEIALELAGPGKERLPVIVNGLERRVSRSRLRYHRHGDSVLGMAEQKHKLIVDCLVVRVFPRRFDAHHAFGRHDDELRFHCASIEQRPLGQGHVCSHALHSGMGSRH
jgi:PAS domain-containing protein